ncbi:MAG: pilus assembly protein PilM [Patescibacteria group bacterium]
MFNFFHESSIGIDIADHSIEVVELDRRGATFYVHKIGRVEMRSGVVERGTIKDEAELIRMVKKVFEVAGIVPTAARAVIYGLPESKVYLHFVTFQKHTVRDLKSLVADEVSRVIPIDLQDLSYEYRITQETKDTASVVIVAVSKTVISQWQKFFLSCDISLALIDVETFAIARGLFGASSSKGASVVVLDLGAVTSTISVFGELGIVYSHSVPVGGEYLTDAIARDLEVSVKEAEERKRAGGLMHKNTKSISSIIKALEPIVSECKSIANHMTGAPVSEFVCVGGSARMPGFIEYMKSNLDIPVRIGSPIFVETFPKTIDVKSDSLLYIEAIGLALRHFQNNDPSFDGQYQGHSFAKMFPWRS